eukprot:1147892-Pelagomonas_calceolata.AAC.4
MGAAQATSPWGQVVPGPRAGFWALCRVGEVAAMAVAEHPGWTIDHLVLPLEAKSYQVIGADMSLRTIIGPQSILLYPVISGKVVSGHGADKSLRNIIDPQSTVDNVDHHAPM